MNQRRGLGRGLGALIPGADPDAGTSAAPAAPAARVAPVAPVAPVAQPAPDTGPAQDDVAAIEGVRYAELLPAQIVPNPRQPRVVFDEESLAELVHSIREIGLLQPVVVRPVGADRYELVAGERRWRAGQQAGLARIPAIVRETPDDALLRDALLENLHRAQLNALEEAAAYQQLLDDFGCTQEELAGRIGRSRPQISNTLRLLKLPPPVQRRVAAGVLSAGHARALLALDDETAMETLAGRVVAEGISVRSLEDLVATGGADGRARPRTSRPRTPTLRTYADVADRLADALDTRVRIDGTRSRGRIVIDWAGPDDLARLVDLLTDR